MSASTSPSSPAHVNNPTDCLLPVQKPASGLRPPNQYPVATAPTMGLMEMTDSQSNARAHSMAPPQGMKRAYAGTGMRLAVAICPPPWIGC